MKREPMPALSFKLLLQAVRAWMESPVRHAWVNAAAMAGLPAHTQILELDIYTRCLSCSVHGESAGPTLGCTTLSRFSQGALLTALSPGMLPNSQIQAPALLETVLCFQGSGAVLPCCLRNTDMAALAACDTSGSGAAWSLET